MSDSVPDPNGDSPDEGEPDASSSRRPAKLPTERTHGMFGKPPQPEFIDELGGDVAGPLFGDKRYEGFRKQMAFAGAAFLILAVGLTLLFWPREVPVMAELPPPAPLPTPTPPPPLTAERIRQAQLEERRWQLQRAVGERNWPEIEPRAQQVLEMEPGDGEAWHAIGWVQEKNGDAVAAAESYGKAITAGFLPAHSHLKRAAMYRRLGKYAEAIRDLEESARLDPESTISPNLLLICQIQAGQPDSARSAVAGFEQAGLVANADRYLLGKAAVLLHQGDFPKAAQALADFQSRVPAPLFAVLAQDRFFDPYRSNPTVQQFLVIP